ncbi:MULTISPECIES: LysR family transcriptional regulator [Variovorax]|uniref:LysR family transcriptional regulator n=1 Tax=Variovorax TaxID=34072 RepID=UPI000F7F5A01|nr:LysR family transcriptional regulator [Variovorax sp. 369]RTD96065.1 LysR family transcriptional regulator [Variovorax sp. 369]
MATLLPPPPQADRIELMQTFVRIVEAGSLSAAAAQMGTTQPTVSRRLQALERSLGVRLLQRSTHAMKLTEDGERCFDRAKELILSWGAFEAELRGVGDQPEGRLRVVVPHAFGQQLLVGPLASYLKRHPQVTVEWLLHDSPHDATPDFIAEGVDCAIRVGEVTDPNAVAIRLFDVPRIAVGAPSLFGAGTPVPAHPGELEALPWLAARNFYRTEVVFTHEGTGEVYRVPIRPRMITDSLYALRSAAVLGAGVGVSSAWMLTEELEAGRLVHLAPRWRGVPAPVYIVYPYARFYPARLRLFVEAMRQAFPESPIPAAGAPGNGPDDRRDDG